MLKNVTLNEDKYYNVEIWLPERNALLMRKVLKWEDRNVWMSNYRNYVDEDSYKV